MSFLWEPSMAPPEVAGDQYQKWGWRSRVDGRTQNSKTESSGPTVATLCPAWPSANRQRSVEEETEGERHVLVTVCVHSRGLCLPWKLLSSLPPLLTAASSQPLKSPQPAACAHCVYLTQVYLTPPVPHTACTSHHVVCTPHCVPQTTGTTVSFTSECEEGILLFCKLRLPQITIRNNNVRLGI